MIWRARIVAHSRPWPSRSDDNPAIAALNVVLGAVGARGSGFVQQVDAN